MRHPGETGLFMSCRMASICSSWIPSFRQSGEFEDVRIADQIGNAQGRLGGLRTRRFNDLLLLGGQACALVQHGLDLTLELAHRPVALEAFILLKGALPWFIQPHKLHQMRPRKLQ
jgi:hypothetical protein